MSPLRVLLAGVAGGLVMFGWGAASHMLLPVGEFGVSSLPAEAELLPAMKRSITERGFYLFPGMSKDASEAEQQAWVDRYRSGPRGALVYDPSGGEAMSPKQLGAELGSNVLAGLVAAIVLSFLAAPYGGRVALVTALGAFAWLSIDVSYWTWYRFPTDFTAAGLLDQAVGWLLAGLAMAAIVKPPGATGAGGPLGPS